MGSNGASLILLAQYIALGLAVLVLIDRLNYVNDFRFQEQIDAVEYCDLLMVNLNFCLLSYIKLKQLITTWKS
jgi:tRNA uridine 5-carbamoylmethylation protein Kti12